MHRSMRQSTGKFDSAATNLNYEYCCAKVTLVFFKLMGLAPLTVVRSVLPKNTMKKNLSKPSATIRFAYSSLGSLYNVFLIVCLMGIISQSLPIVHKIDYLFKSNLTVAIELVETICGNLAVIVIWLSFCIRQTTAVKLLNRLTKIDCAILDLSGGSEVESSRYYLILLFGANVLLRIAVVVTNQLYFKSPVLGWFNNIVPCTIVIWFTVQYVMMIKLLETRFRRLNRCLLNNARSLIVRPIRTLILESNTMDYNFFPKIIAFRRAHISLYELANDIADFYSLPIVLAIAFTCYSIVYNSYYAVLPIVVKIESNGTLMCIASVMWLISMATPITILSVNVEGMTDQMRKTADVVHKFLTRELNTREEKLELEEFSRELLQRNVKFAAYGLFQLDYSLVQSICSMVGIYLIILLQFQMSPSKSDVKIVTHNVTDVKLNSS